MVALSAVWARRVACSVAVWLLAWPLAHADPAGDPAPSAAGSLSKELEGHLWRIGAVAFGRFRPRYLDNYIVPGSDNGSDARITFENGEIGGNLGCGQLTGRYSLSGDRVSISALSNTERKGCSRQFRERADEVVSALKAAVRLERRGEDAFYLFDEQKTYFIHLQLLSPGFDLSELRPSFWRLVSLEGDSIAKPDAEVRLNGRMLEVSSSGFVAEFKLRYSLRKFTFDGPFSTTRPGGRDLPPLFETFGQAMHKMVSYSVNGDELAALDAFGHQIMLLKRIRPTGPEYGYWHIAQYGLEGVLNPTLGDPQSHLITFVRGELQGNGGCPGFRGNYTLADDHLSIKAGTISLAGWCPMQATIQNDLVIQALNKASRFKEDGPRMLLQDAQGNTNIVLVPYAQQTPH